MSSPVAYTMTCTRNHAGRRDSYFVCTVFDRHEAYTQLRLLSQTVREKAPSEHRAAYDKLYWTGAQPAGGATPRRSLDGSYLTYCEIDHIGILEYPEAVDGVYNMPRCSWGASQSDDASQDIDGWTFYINAASAPAGRLESVWPVLGISAAEWDIAGYHPVPSLEEDDESSDELIDSALDRAEYYADY